LSFNTNDLVLTLGYPDQGQTSNLGMWEYEGSYLPNTCCGSIIGNISFNQKIFGFGSTPIQEGQSGSPAFRNSEFEAFGIMSAAFNNGSTNRRGLVNGFTVNQIDVISQWTNWGPTVHIIFPAWPMLGETYNLVNIPDFSVIINDIKKIDLNGNIKEKNKNIEDLVEWESNIDGLFGNGGIVLSEDLKTSLSRGTHIITAKIDSQNEQGEASVHINIIKPTGEFTLNDFCIISLSSSSLNSCQMNIGWSVTNTPATSVVWNETDNTEFATGNSGSQSFTATTNTTTFNLYPSDERIILLDTLNAQAKLPTGNLTVPSSQCSLQPSPVAPNGTMRDPKATPPGCGTELSWSNVQWASPSIYYKPVGSGSWAHLYDIPCSLNGTICKGSLHTDDYVPELISASGVEFKLVQFQNENSGNLTVAFTVTAKRFADAYEFDDGFFDLGGSDADNQNLAKNGNITTETDLDVPQHNHNFHRPAAYDSAIDRDSFNISTSDMTNSTQLEVKLFNMAAGLRVGFEVQCSGLRFIDEIGGSEGEDYSGVWDIPESPIVVDSYDATTRTATMRFNVVKYRTYPDPGLGSTTQTRLSCQHNRVIVNRTAGQAGEDLTYSVVVTNPSGVNPGELKLDSVADLGATSYKVELIGDDFGVNSGSNLSVVVRAGNSSQTLATYSSAYFHNQGTFAASHIYEGKDSVSQSSKPVDKVYSEITACVSRF